MQHTYVFNKPHYQKAECDIRSIFNQSKASLNSAFSFSQTGCLTKAKEPSVPYYLPIAEERNKNHAFPKSISTN